MEAELLKISLAFRGLSDEDQEEGFEDDVELPEEELNDDEDEDGADGLDAGNDGDEPEDEGATAEE